MQGRFEDISGPKNAFESKLLERESSCALGSTLYRVNGLNIFLYSTTKHLFQGFNGVVDA